MTSAGAATNSTIRACSTSVSSFGVPALACIATPPTLIAPNSRPASTVPSGLARPSSATVIASKPIEPGSVGLSEFWLPSTCMVAASPASGPGEEHREGVDLRDAHARRCATRRALAPTARSSKPQVLRSSSHQTATPARIARITPKWTSKLSPNGVGKRGRVVDPRRERVVAAGSLEGVVAERVDQHRGREVVEHDRGDDLVGAGAGLEEARDAAPDGTAQQPGDQGDQQVQAGRQVPGEADVAGADRADDQLALGTDVEQAGAERQGHAEARADQRRRTVERRGDRVARPDGALDERAVGRPDGVGRPGEEVPRVAEEVAAATR